LPLQLVDLNGTAAAIRKFRALGQGADIFDRDRLGVTIQYIEEMSNSPGTLVAISKLI
jgi:hypothetical protein